MTATLEEEVRAKRNLEIAAFVMPKPSMGQCVTWYSSGTRTSLGENAFVLSVGRRNLVISRASGVAMESVRHIDDPKLQLSDEQRLSGAWDFTERDKQQDKFTEMAASLVKQVASLVERVTALEEFFNESSKPKKDKA